jgi:hypothetical protein
MKYNTKLFFLLLLIAPLFFSCKKDSSSDDSSHYFKFKMNGNWITWKEALADVAVQSGQTSFNFSARNEGATEYVYMLVNPNNGGSLVPGTYTPDNSLLKVSYVKRLNAVDFTNYSDDAFGSPADTRYEITVTSITDKTIKGTFKGNYLTNDFNDNDKLNVTEGEFSLQRVR